MEKVTLWKGKLLNCGANKKTRKSDSKGEYLTAALSLASGNRSGYEVCPHRTEGCFKSCLDMVGMGSYPHVRKSRTRKTQRFFEDRARFMADLYMDIAKFRRYTLKKGKGTVVRLNMYSDIPWERISFNDCGLPFKNIFEAFPDVHFYDYTKNPFRGNLPENYRLIFSLSEKNETHARRALRNGQNVAVVFEKGRVPGMFWGVPVIPGDEDDLRFLDPEGVIIGLNSKGGPAFKDNTGFIVREKACNAISSK